ncbi:MAG: hypothetical protein SPH68_05875 [Candidatus Borkfalkiaceae bacterium]|nr:hypothetical protein [Clostridia bacterium]MDY6223669.1 hypothetical protein [Christensenellaceae bacterium]
MDVKYYIGKGIEEKPLQNIIQGGMCSVFKRIGCIGDSLSAGEIGAINAEGQPFYWDTYEYSWPAYMAKHTGCEVLNFSRGGMTAKEYVESFAETNGYWDRDTVRKNFRQAYYILLSPAEVSYFLLF